MRPRVAAWGALGAWSALRRRSLGVLVALLTVAGLAACTGTREARTPALLVIAEGQRVGIVASPLPPETVPGRAQLAWLPEFERELDGPVVDLAVARELPTRVFVAYRGPEGDRIQPFLAEAITPGAPATFAEDGPAIPVEELVGEALVSDPCTAAIRVTNDGRWLALLHRPAACDGDAAGDAVVLLHLGEDPQDARVAYPEVGSRPDAATPPLFLEPTGGSDAGTMIYLEEDGTIVRVRLSADGEVEAFPGAGVVDRPLDLGTGGIGIVVAEDDRLHSLPIARDGEPVSLAVPPGVLAVVDAATLPSATAVAITTAGVVVRTALSEDDPPDAAELLLPVSVATVGPYGYGFLASEGRLVAVDLLEFVTTADPEVDRLSSFVVPNVGGTAMPWGDPVAIDWLFGAVPTELP